MNIDSTKVENELFAMSHRQKERRRRVGVATQVLALSDDAFEALWQGLDVSVSSPNYYKKTRIPNLLSMNVYDLTAVWRGATTFEQRRRLWWCAIVQYALAFDRKALLKKARTLFVELSDRRINLGEGAEVHFLVGDTAVRVRHAPTHRDVISRLPLHGVAQGWFRNPFSPLSDAAESVTRTSDTARTFLEKLESALSSVFGTYSQATEAVMSGVKFVADHAITLARALARIILACLQAYLAWRDADHASRAIHITTALALIEATIPEEFYSAGFGAIKKLCEGTYGSNQSAFNEIAAAIDEIASEGGASQELPKAQSESYDTSTRAQAWRILLKWFAVPFVALFTWIQHKLCDLKLADCVTAMRNFSIVVAGIKSFHEVLNWVRTKVTELINNAHGYCDAPDADMIHSWTVSKDYALNLRAMAADKDVTALVEVDAHMRRAHSLGLTISQAIERYKHGGEVYAVHFHKAFNEFEKQYAEYTCDGEKRPPPFVLNLYGPSGVGKSWVTQVLANCYIDEFIRTPCSKYAAENRLAVPNFTERNTVYVKNTADPYWEGYRGQPIVVIDDIFQLAVVPGAMNPEARMLIELANPIPSTLNMAFDDKGKTRFTTQVIMTSSNQHPAEYNHQAAITCPDAVTRRFDLIVRVVLKTAVHKVGNTITVNANEPRKEDVDVMEDLAFLIMKGDQIEFMYDTKSFYGYLRAAIQLHRQKGYLAIHKMRDNVKALVGNKEIPVQFEALTELERVRARADPSSLVRDAFKKAGETEVEEYYSAQSGDFEEVPLEGPLRKMVSSLREIVHDEKFDHMDPRLDIYCTLVKWLSLRRREQPSVLEVAAIPRDENFNKQLMRSTVDRALAKIVDEEPEQAIAQFLRTTLDKLILLVPDNNDQADAIAHVQKCLCCIATLYPHGTDFTQLQYVLPPLDQFKSELSEATETAVAMKYELMPIEYKETVEEFCQLEAEDFTTSSPKQEKKEASAESSSSSAHLSSKERKRVAREQEAQAREQRARASVNVKEQKEREAVENAINEIFRKYPVAIADKRRFVEAHPTASSIDILTYLQKREPILRVKAKLAAELVWVPTPEDMQHPRTKMHAFVEVHARCLYPYMMWWTTRKLAHKTLTIESAENHMRLSEEIMSADSPYHVSRTRDLTAVWNALNSCDAEALREWATMLNHLNDPTMLSWLSVLPVVLGKSPLPLPAIGYPYPESCVPALEEVCRDLVRGAFGSKTLFLAMLMEKMIRFSKTAETDLRIIALKKTNEAVVYMNDVCERAKQAWAKHRSSVTTYLGILGTSILIAGGTYTVGMLLLPLFLRYVMATMPKSAQLTVFDHTPRQQDSREPIALSSVDSPAAQETMQSSPNDIGRSAEIRKGARKGERDLQRYTYGQEAEDEEATPYKARIYKWVERIFPDAFAKYCAVGNAQITNAAAQTQILHLTRSQYRISVVTQDNEMKYLVLGLFIAGGRLLTVAHALRTIKAAKRLHLTNIPIANGTGQNPARSIIDVEVSSLNFVVIPDTDAMIIEMSGTETMPNLCSKFKDISYDFSGHNKVFTGILRDAGEQWATYVAELPDVKVEKRTYICPSLDNNGERTLVNNAALAYNLRTSNGDCGSLILGVDNGSVSILGIHVAGMVTGSMGIGVRITASMLESARAQMSLELERFAIAPCHVVTQRSGQGPLLHTRGQIRGSGNMTAAGWIKTHTIPEKTNIVPSWISGVFQQPTTAPVRTAPFHNSAGVRLDPLDIALNKLAPVAKVVDPNVISACVMSYYSKISHLPGRSARVLTVDQAIFGDDNPRSYIRPMNLNKSAGFPWTILGGPTPTGTLKKDFINAETRALHKALAGEIRFRLDEAGLGRCHAVVCQAFLKDERKALADVDAGKARMFQSLPTDMVIILRMYFGEFIAFLTENLVHVEACVGINPSDASWHTLALYLTKFGDRVVCSDFKSFDACQGPQWVAAFATIANHWYTSRGAQEKDNNIRKCLWLGIARTMTLADGILYDLMHGNPSGQPATTFTNSIYVSLLFRAMYGFLAHEKYNTGVMSAISEFNSNVNLATYGDDNAANISPVAATFFTPTGMVRAAAHYGATLTGADKKGPPLATPLAQATFLKRGFVLLDGKYVGPLSIDVLRELVNWTHKGITKEEFGVSLIGYQLELALHGAKVYGEMMALMDRACAEQGIPFERLSWQAAIERLKHGPLNVNEDEGDFEAQVGIAQCWSLPDYLEHTDSAYFRKKRFARFLRETEGGFDYPVCPRHNFNEALCQVLEEQARRGTYIAAEVRQHLLWRRAQLPYDITNFRSTAQWILSQMAKAEADKRQGLCDCVRVIYRPETTTPETGSGAAVLTEQDLAAARDTNGHHAIAQSGSEIAERSWISTQATENHNNDNNTTNNNSSISQGLLGKGTAKDVLAQKTIIEKSDASWIEHDSSVSFVTVPYKTPACITDDGTSSLEKMFSRWTLIQENTWNPSVTGFITPGGVNIYGVMVAREPWNSYSVDYARMRGDVEIMLSTTASATAVGRVVMFWVPLYACRGNYGVPEINPTIHYASHPHIVVDASTSATGVLRVPFYWIQDAWDMTTSVGPGQVWVLILNPLVNPNNSAIKIQMHARFTNTSFSGPTYRGQSEDVGVAQMENGIMAGRPDMTRPSGVLRAAGWVAGMMADSAEYMGYSVPITNQVPTRMLDTYSTNLGQGVTGDSSQKLSVTQDADVSRELTMSNGVDEMNIETICNQWSALDTFTISNGTNTQLWSTGVHIGLSANAPGYEVNAVQPTFMSQTAALFRLWNADIRFRFEVVKNPYVMGRLIAFYIPDSQPTVDINDNAVRQRLPRFICDFHDKTNCEIIVPWNSIERFKQVQLEEHGAHAPTVSNASAWDNGRLYLYTLGNWQFPTGITSVQVNVFVSACNVSLYGIGGGFRRADTTLVAKTRPPRNRVITRARAQGTDAKLDVNAHPHYITPAGTCSSKELAAAMCCEKIASLRTLVKRPAILFFAEGAEAEFSINTAYMPDPSDGLAESHFFMIVQMFRVWRGSVRVKVVVTESKASTTNSQHGVCLAWLSRPKTTTFLTVGDTAIWDHAQPLAAAKYSDHAAEFEVPYQSSRPFTQVTDVATAVSLPDQNQFNFALQDVDTWSGYTFYCGGDSFALSGNVLCAPLVQLDPYQ